VSTDAGPAVAGHERIAAAFDGARAEHRAALIVYLTAC
jgi:hypothetical protein